MNKDLTGKVAIITGASRGLGRELCYYLSNLGIKIVAIARSGKVENIFFDKNLIFRVVV